MQLIESKRAYNINIALARFRMHQNAIRDAILAMDFAILNPEKLSTLIKCSPTPEEVAAIKGFEGEEKVAPSPLPARQPTPCITPPAMHPRPPIGPPHVYVVSCLGCESMLVSAAVVWCGVLV